MNTIIDRINWVSRNLHGLVELTDLGMHKVDDEFCYVTQAKQNIKGCPVVYNIPISSDLLKESSQPHELRAAVDFAVIYAMKTIKEES